jgi:spore coat polysaccharide biosynthesis protein SpsF
LAALRAANQKHETILATSVDSSDDELVASSLQYGIRVFRGSLDDVLGRFFHGSSHLTGNDAVIRLTADNLVPDGNFVRQLAQAFVRENVDYLSTDPLESRVPYGVAGEVFSVAALRRAHALATSRFDREHVGPWMKRNCNSAVFAPDLPAAEDFSHLRCTIDDEHDYDRMVQLFATVNDALGAGWVELVRNLALLPGAPTFHVPSRMISAQRESECVLGTAQLGMPYGRVNQTGQPTRREAVALVRHAIEHGVTALDTARGYRDAELVIGEALAGAWRSRCRVMTKLDIGTPGAQANKNEIEDRVNKSILSSLKALQAERLDVVLLHRWEHHDAWNGAAWERLCELKNDNKIGLLGASVYEPCEALEALNDPVIEHLQIPMNILDRRWEVAGVRRAAENRPDVVVYARSVFLQGILLHPSNRWPRIAGFDATECVSQISAMAKDFDRIGLADFCLSYVRSMPWVTSIVVGCDNLTQLQANLKLFLRPKLTRDELVEVERTLHDVPEALLNPSKWSVAEIRAAAYAS